jgi:hypothetical protein
VLKTLGSALLILLQWTLVLWGMFLILLALQTYSMESRWVATLPLATLGQDGFAPPTIQRLATAGLTGLIAMGLGAALFCLRRIHLRPTS